jgi:hypothetical protein
MTTSPKNRPSCFANLEKVFPKAEHGLRESPKDCLACPFKTACLRAALAGNSGLKIRDELVDRAYTTGHMSFFERWSRKKTIENRRKNQTKDGATGKGSQG